MLRYIEFEAPHRAVMARAPLPALSADEALVEATQTRNYAGDGTR